MNTFTIVSMYSLIMLVLLWYKNSFSFIILSFLPFYVFFWITIKKFCSYSRCSFTFYGAYISYSHTLDIRSGILTQVIHIKKYPLQSGLTEFLGRTNFLFPAISKYLFFDFSASVPRSFRVSLISLSLPSCVKYDLFLFWLLYDSFSCFSHKKDLSPSSNTSGYLCFT